MKYPFGILSVSFWLNPWYPLRILKEKKNLDTLKSDLKAQGYT